MESECEAENKVYQYAIFRCIVCDMCATLKTDSAHVVPHPCRNVLSLDRAGTVGPVKQSYGSDHASCHVKEHWNYTKSYLFLQTHKLLNERHRPFRTTRNLVLALPITRLEGPLVGDGGLEGGRMIEGNNEPGVSVDKPPQFFIHSFLPFFSFVTASYSALERSSALAGLNNRLPCFMNTAAPVNSESTNTPCRPS